MSSGGVRGREVPLLCGGPWPGGGDVSWPYGGPCWWRPASRGHHLVDGHGRRHIRPLEAVIDVPSEYRQILSKPEKYR